MLGLWLISLMNEQTYKVVAEQVHGVRGESGAANIAAFNFMDNHDDAEWFCLVDNDVGPPIDMLRILDELPDHVAIVSPVCHQLVVDKVVPQQGYYKTSDGGTDFVPLDTAQKGLVRVDRVGGGVWFTRRRVFASMARPYFKIVHDPDTYVLVGSDDLYFQRLAQLNGFGLYCDTRYVASHYHTVDLSLNERMSQR
jgi:hypothetical protein